MSEHVATGSIPTTGTATSGAPDHTSRNNLVINLLLVSAFVVMLNETIMNVAIPQIMNQLNIEAATGQWLTTGFMLTMAIIIPTTGYLLSRFSTRQIFIAAMSLFTLGTVISAIAPGFGVLLLGRIVQASGTAVMMPLLMTTVMTLVPFGERGKTMGKISVVMSVAPAVGPTLSGLVLQVLDWRWLFIIVAPIAIGALTLGIAKVQNVTDPQKKRIDVLSVILAAFAFGGLIFGLSSIGESVSGHAIVQPGIPVAVGVVALAGFILRQLALQKRDAALLDLRTFRTGQFVASVVLMAFLMMAMFGSVILLPIYLQNVLGLEPVFTGLTLLPGALLMGVLGPIVGRIFDKRGPRILLVPGSIVASAGLWSFTLLTADSSPFQVLASHVILSLGLATMFPPLFSSALGSLQPKLYPHGSAIIGTLQQVAAASGTALFVTLFTIQQVALTAEGVDPVNAMAGGVHAAFMTGAIVSLGTIVVTFFIKRPVNVVEGAPGH